LVAILDGNQCEVLDYKDGEIDLFIDEHINIS
jgi:hypothetical protein